MTEGGYIKNCEKPIYNIQKSTKKNHLAIP